MKFSWRDFLANGRASLTRPLANAAAAITPPAWISAPAAAPARMFAPVHAPAQAYAPAPIPVPVAAPEHMIYVYGVTRGDPMTQSAAPLVEGVIPGVPVEVLPLGDIAVLFNRVPKSAALSANNDDEDEEAKWTNPKALRHHRVLENLGLVCTVAPVKYGAVYPSLKDVIAHFVGNCDFRRTLARVAGAHEWSVRLYADMRKCCTQAENMPLLVALKAELAAAAPAHAPMVRNKLHNAIDREVCDNLAACAGNVHRRLGVAARAAKLNALSGNGSEVWNGNAPALILDALYLIEKRQVINFHHAISELTRRFSANGFTIKLGGPWPPYSFATADAAVSSDRSASAA